MNLSIVVLTYNAKDVTLKMLDSLRKSLDFIDKHSDVEYEVIVVDNGSTDGVADEIDKNYKWLKLIRNENVGFAKGNNRGIQEVDPDTDYVLFLNPDIILDKDVILKMYDYAVDHHDVGIVSCRVDMYTGGYDWDAHRGFPTPWRAFCYFTYLEKLLAKSLADMIQRRFPPKTGEKLAYKLRKWFGGYHLLHLDMNKTHEVDVVLGAFMLIPKIVGDSLGWWPTDYFLNGEDVDLCYQVKVLHKTKVMYVPTSKIIHFKGASKGTKKQSQKISSASNETKSLQINSGIDAMKIFYDKYYAQKYPWIVNKIVALGIWLLYKKRLLTKTE